MIERLHFGADVKYSGLEASIHLARYQLARDFVSGKKVLDIACGEGYGSAWLKKWGALEVDGVDVSIEAVRNANSNFGQATVNFHVYDAENVLALLQGRKFDVIVSLETIEHLNNPTAYLKCLKSLLAEDGVLIISCPNDWWYYPTEADHNPYHVRKFIMAEFQSLTTAVLGEPHQWGIGTALAGFVNQGVPQKLVASANDDQRLMMASATIENAYVVPVAVDAMTVPENSSYFFGIWGSASTQTSAALLPVPMDVFRNGFYSGAEQAAAVTAQGGATASPVQIELQAHLREARLRIAALVVENTVLKENMSKDFHNVNELRHAISYWRSEWEQLLQKYDEKERELQHAISYWRSEWEQLLQKYDAVRATPSMYRRIAPRIRSALLKKG